MEGHLVERRGKRGRVWYLVFDAPRKHGAKRSQQKVRLGSMPKSHAIARKREILSEVDNGTWAGRRDDIRVVQFFDRWLAAIRHRVAATTYARYAGLVELHFKPAIGALMLRKVEPEHIRQIDQRLVARQLSPRSRLHAHRALHTAFTWAIQENKKMLDENPVARVKAPKVDSGTSSLISHDKVRSVLNAVKGTRLEVPVMIAALTGLRRGELLALKWQNVSLEVDMPSLYVAEALEHTRAYGVRFKAPKSAKSRASVPLAPECVELLREHRAAQDEVKRDAGLHYEDQGLVFPNPDGSVWPPDSFSVQFGRLARSAGHGGFKLHDLRHGFATLLVANGVSLKEVSGLLRHSSESLTLSTYTHRVNGAGQAAVSGLARSLLQAKGAASP